MITMEFEEMKKIWDLQNSEPLFAINEKALHNRILSKKHKGYHITNFSEWLVIITYIGTGCFIAGMNLVKQSTNVFMYLLAAWMVVSALYAMVSRVRRIRANARFDRSLLGDLNHAVSLAAYQVRFSQLMRWNILPISILMLLGIWESGQSVWVALAMLAFLVLANYAAGWEHGIYRSRKLELETLQRKLIDQDQPDPL